MPTEAELREAFDKMDSDKSVSCVQSLLLISSEFSVLTVGGNDVSKLGRVIPLGQCNLASGVR
jgi:hypothetical protein